MFGVVEIVVVEGQWGVFDWYFVVVVVDLGLFFEVFEVDVEGE